MRLLNVGCGRCIHAAWTNIDLVSAVPGVISHDLRTGLPFDDNEFDAVYHSHVLEHLTPVDASTMLRECLRVLKPKGVLRVVVPDLEGIARAYLRAVDDAGNERSPESHANHTWMTLELIDQMTRQKTGGLMLPAMQDPDQLNHHFIVSRLGHEVGGNTTRSSVRVRKTLGQLMSKNLRSVRKRLALAAVSLLEGPSGGNAYREGRFRQSGEIHRWMYDRVSLANLLRTTGFEDAMACQAEESRIASFDSYQLDRDGQSVRKPDSLYIEAIKKTAVNQLPRPLPRDQAA